MATLPAPFKHVVVLMFENRSFDHIMGAMPNVNGLFDASGNLKPECYNSSNPLNPPGTPGNKVYYPTAITPDTQLPHDYNHDFGDGMMPDLFGPGTNGYTNGPLPAAQTTYPATNSGFISARGNSKSYSDDSVLWYYQANSLQVFHKLATEFVICDGFHCDLPGHTNPNRSFMHTATTGNTNLNENNNQNEKNKTIFNLLDELNPSGNGNNWKIYEFPDPMVGSDAYFLDRIIDNTRAYCPLTDFQTDITTGNLPFYSFLMCWNTSGDVNTSMHPAADIRYGENYLADVYNLFRQSPHWEDTLLVVTFDENGGLYDHVMPGQTVYPLSHVPHDPNPSLVDPTTGEQFDYTLLGLRVPAMFISPWLNAGTDSSVYRNTSILRYIEDLASGDTTLQVALTDRDSTALSIANTFTHFGTTTARTDCPESLQGYDLPGYISPFSTPSPEQLEKINSEKPATHTVALVKEYISGLQGHADSGKPITRVFETAGELKAYSRERREAHLAYLADN